MTNDDIDLTRLCDALLAIHKRITGLEDRLAALKEEVRTIRDDQVKQAHRHEALKVELGPVLDVLEGAYDRGYREAESDSTRLVGLVRD